MNNVYVYGGAFDPFTKAHLKIVKLLAKLCNEGDSLDILVSNTDEKNYVTDINKRIDMVKTAIKQFETKNINVCEQKYRTYRFLKSNYVDKKVTIVIGTDEWNALRSGKWIDSDELLAEYSFLVFKRGDFAIIPCNVDVNTVQLEDDALNNVSSSKCRDILFKNPLCHYHDVQEYITKPVFYYIKDEKLYWQNGTDYEKDEAAFLKNYQKQKIENNWSEPSVTADILAHNGNELING